MPSFIRLGTETAVNSTFVRSQAQAETSRLANGNYIVVWTDADFNTSAGRFLRAQIFQPDGTPVGGELTLFSGSFVSHPNVTGLAGGGFAMTWISSTSIRVQIFDGAGAAVGSAFTATPSTGASSVARPEIAALEGGGFVVTWQDNRTSGSDISGSGIHLRQYDASGAAVGGDILVNIATAGNQADPSVSALAGGGYVVTWTDRGASGSGAPWLITSQIFNASGGRVGSEIVVNSITSGVSSVESSVTALAGGGFAVGWYESDTLNGSGHRIRIFDPSGAAVGATIAFEPGFSGTQTGPVVAALSDGSIAVAWVANSAPLSDGSGRAIYVQVFGANGVADGPAMLVNTQANGDQIDPAIVALSVGRFAVTWTDLNGSGADDDEVRTQVFGPQPTIAITSDGGGDTAVLSVTEIQTGATLVAAIGANVTYSIAGGADAALFTIDAETGLLSFINAPDFEAPGDAGADNVYDLIVTASDGTATDTQALSITVNNINEAVTINSGASYLLSENALSVGNVTATDLDGDTVSYTIAGGVDAVLFNIDAVTGALSFVSAPNFENPGDEGGDNVYDVIVSASDGTLSDFRSVSVNVTNANEAVSITSPSAYATSENGVAIGSVTAFDLDGNTISFAIIGGADAARFAIDSETGILSFVASLDFEAPVDADGDSVYDVIIAASDGILTDTRSLAVTVTNANEAPTITSDGSGASASLTVAENGSAATIVQSTDPEGNPRSYAIVGGADAARFAINVTTGALTFIATPNFELPTDADGNNVYDVLVAASDGALSDTQALSITISNVNEAPVITSNGGGSSATVAVNENSLAVTVVTANDPDGTPRSYAIAGGADAARFTINSTTGALSFIAAPNYEAPTDAGANNVYDVVVTASDGVNLATQTIAVSINNLVDGSTINGTNAANTLTGTNAEDTINGLNGGDTITGGLGADRLTGGSGADRFVYTAVNQSLVGATDFITDFSRTQGDRISLSGIDARTTVSGDQAFTFIGSAAFSNVAGQLRYQQVNGNTFVSGDVNGDGVADFMIQVNGNVVFQSGDFIL